MLSFAPVPPSTLFLYTIISHGIPTVLYSGILSFMDQAMNDSSIQTDRITMMKIQNLVDLFINGNNKKKSKFNDDIT